MGNPRVSPDRISNSEELKEQIGLAQKQGKEALTSLEKQLGDISNIEPDVVHELFLAYRSLSA